MSTEIYFTEQRTNEENKKLIEALSNAKNEMVNALNDVYNDDYPGINRSIVNELRDCIALISSIQYQVENGAIDRLCSDSNEKSKEIEFIH